MDLDEAMAMAIREELGQYDDYMARISPSNPDYFGEEDIARVIKRFHQLFDTTILEILES
jgi:hypothetical protein